MTHLHAVVRQGKLELSEPITLPEGTHVNVIVEPLEELHRSEPGQIRTDNSTDPLLDLEAWAAEGPIDLAAQHDHYASGTPKKG